MLKQLGEKDRLVVKLMPRHPRIHYPGAVFHVIARGNNQNNIFHDQTDFRKYLLILKETLTKMPFYVLAYALMNNHIHILIEVNEVELSKIMKLVQQRYTQYYNKKYGTYGHVFQGRFKALLVDKENYLLQLIYYIHTNPLNAGLDVELGTYTWTGHHELVNNKRLILDSIRLMAYIEDDIEKAKVKYIQLFSKPVLSELSQEVYIRGEDTDKPTMTATTVLHNVSKDSLLQLVCRFTGSDPELVTGKSRQCNVVNARKVFVFIAKQYCDMPGYEIAEFLAKTPEHISRMYQQVIMDNYPELNSIINLVVKNLSLGKT